MPKRLLSGMVVASKNDKTIVVEVTRRVRHKLYKKIIKRVKKYHAHDEKNIFKVGDAVTIQETRPISKMKTWTALNDKVSLEEKKAEWFKCNQIYL